MGAFLLVLAFLLQIFAAFASPFTSTVIPHWLQNWFYLALIIVVPIVVIASLVSWSLYRLTMRKILRIDAEDAEKAEMEKLPEKEKVSN